MSQKHFLAGFASGLADELKKEGEDPRQVAKDKAQAKVAAAKGKDPKKK
jgi:hypothetical protein